MNPLFLHLEEIDSTSAYIQRRFSDLPDRFFLSASFQTSGKGRGDHVWEARPGENLLCSLLLKEEATVKRGPILSLAAAVAVARTLSALGLRDIAIKWPNDILAGGKKITGILLKGCLPGYVVIGIGINANQKDFPSGYGQVPTSICLQIGREIDIQELKQALYDELMKVLKESDESLLSTYASMDFLKGKRISFLWNDLPRVGVARGVNEDFFLLVETGYTLMPLSSGEVSLVRTE